MNNPFKFKIGKFYFTKLFDKINGYGTGFIIKHENGRIEDTRQRFYRVFPFIGIYKKLRRATEEEAILYGWYKRYNSLGDEIKPVKGLSHWAEQNKPKRFSAKK